MNFDKISVLLKKIERIVDTLKEADIEVSSIEQELILSYIRELNHAVTEGATQAPVTPAPRIQELPKIEKEPATKKTQEPVAYTEPEPKAKTFVSTKPEPVAVIEENTGEEISRDELTAPIPLTDEPVSENEEPAIPDELSELFEIKSGTELSDKLSLSPIRDLRKSMGVNERIFTINELFRGNQKMFDEVILHLNELSNFGQASDYLMQTVARTNHWEEREKKKKAEHFIRLVYRRYL